MTREERIQLNKLKIKRGALVEELRKTYHEIHGRIPMYDALTQIYLYCDYEIGKVNDLTMKAKEVQELSHEIYRIENVNYWSTWNVCRLYINNHIERGSFKEEEDIDRAARFLSHVEEQLEKIGSPFYGEEENRKLSKADRSKGKEKKKVFISYSHADQEWLKRIRLHLRPIERKYEVEFWDDSKIKAGSMWKEEIKKGIHSASVAVLMISANFFASDFIAEEELPPILEKAEADGTVVLSLILSPSRFRRVAELADIQAVNSPQKPLNSLDYHEQEAIFEKLAEAVEGILLAEEMDKLN